MAGRFRRGWRHVLVMGSIGTAGGLLGTFAGTRIAGFAGDTRAFGVIDLIFRLGVVATGLVVGTVLGVVFGNLVWNLGTRKMRTPEGMGAGGSAGGSPPGQSNPARQPTRREGR